MNGMTIIVKKIASWVKVLIFLFGLYVVFFGDVSPGGGFAGGVILAGAYVLLMLAYGGEYVEKDLPPKAALRLLCVGVLAFAAVAISGFFYGGADGFFWNYIHQESPEFIEAGIIPLAEFAIGLAVGSSLFLVIYTFSTFRTQVSAGEKE